MRSCIYEAGNLTIRTGEKSLHAVLLSHFSLPVYIRSTLFSPSIVFSWLDAHSADYGTHHSGQ